MSRALQTRDAGHHLHRRRRYSVCSEVCKQLRISNRSSFLRHPGGHFPALGPSGETRSARTDTASSRGSSRGARGPSRLLLLSTCWRHQEVGQQPRTNEDCWGALCLLVLPTVQTPGNHCGRLQKKALRKNAPCLQCLPETLPSEARCALSHEDSHR